MSRVLAVDLGATSIRVASVDLAADRPTVQVVHRWRHEPVRDAAGSLRWDWDGIVHQVELGLQIGMETGPVASIGVDGWGVDYGLIDEAGRLVDQPFAYRDTRTSGWERTARRIGIDTLYRTTGVQLMGINTIFQLAADDPQRHARAHRMLLLPDLLVHHLTGWIGAERSNVSTTGLMDARTCDWSDEVIAAIGVERSVFPEPVDAGTCAGQWHGVPIHLVGSHDTASAFVGLPAAKDTVFVSTGSWVIVGVERPAPDTSPAAQAANFSNEAGALGGVRFLKNVVGFWILEQCRAAWGSPPLATLIAEAESVRGVVVPTFDASDQRFLRTGDMLGEVRAAAGLAAGTPRAMVVASILHSIVAGVVRVVDEIEKAIGRRPAGLVLGGGAARMDVLARLLAATSGLEVIVGSSEATALGNAIVQGITLGRFGDLAEARTRLSGEAQ